MFRKTWPVALILILALITFGCGEEKSKTSGNGEQVKFDAAAVVKDLKGKDLPNRIAKYLADGDVDKAVAVGEAAQAKEPDNLAVNLILSNAYYYQKDMLNMIKVSKRMEQMSPQNIMVLNQLAWALIDSGENPAEGIKKAEKAMKIITNTGQEIDISLWDTHALGLYKLNKKKEAIAEWKKIIPQVQNGEVYLHLGQALLDTGKTDEAKQALERALELTELQLKDANNTKVEVNHIKEVRKNIEKQLKSIGSKKI